MRQIERYREIVGRYFKNARIEEDPVKQSKLAKTIPNPEYLAARKEDFKDVLAYGRDCPEDYFPEDYGKKIPEDGAWIQLLAGVHVGMSTPDKDIHVDVPHLSIWYAMPARAECGREVEKGINLHPAQAAIFTPQGEVRIWPREYNIVTDLSKYLKFTEEEGFYIHFLDPSNEGFNQTKLHYIRSRGIDLAQARMMLLPELKGNPHFCYFTFAPEYSEVFPEWTGTPYLGPHNYARRAAARARKAKS